MVDIDEVFRLVKFIGRRSNRGYIGGADFSDIANSVSWELFAEKIGLPEQYQPGHPVPLQGYSVSERVFNDMKPFISDTMPIIVDANGRAKYPLDYVYPASMPRRKLPDGTSVPVVMVYQNELSGYLNSRIKQPSYYYPIAVEYADYMQFYPNVIDGLTWEYLKAPVTVKWAFTLDATGREIYDAANSVHFEWPDMVKNTIITHILQKFGISIRDGELINYAQMLKQSGE